MNYFIIKDNAVLCNDKKWRTFSSFGNNSSFKIFKQKNRVTKLAKSLNASLEFNNKTPNIFVSSLPDKCYLNAVGEIFNQNDELIGTLKDFIIN